MIDRLSFGFHNPNHAAALVCALLPLCFGWRRAAWAGRGLAAGLFVALFLTQSRTGLIVAALEWAAWWTLKRGSRMRFRDQRVDSRGRLFSWLGKAAVAALAVGLSLWWLGPRLALDGSVLNRPRIWLAGLRLFAANPDGVGLGNSGALASAFLLGPDVPEIRTMIGAHLTLLAESGWVAGWAWLSFIGLALCGVRSSPRVGLAFAGLALSGCSSTVFDWPTLFDFAERGGLGTVNWALSWTMLALFLGLGARLAAGAVRRPRSARPAFASAALAGLVVLGLRLVPPGDAPRVRDGYAAGGAAPRTLALHDASWSLREVRARAGRDVLVPVRPVARYPAGLGLGGVGRPERRLPRRADAEGRRLLEAGGLVGPRAPRRARHAGGEVPRRAVGTALLRLLGGQPSREPLPRLAARALPRVREPRLRRLPRAVPEDARRRGARDLRRRRRGHGPDAGALALARALFAAVASGAPCALWGEDDTRRVLPRARIDPEYANPLYTPAMAALWRGE